ncbi:MAG: hypothetical protein OEW48_14865, partial [Phycisphaerae bacterium]|nr:hypothetical protein [Phycisphaerae bacterium]
NYSCIQGLTGALGGTGNIGDDPYFADPCNGDYHLKSQGGRWEPSSQSWVLDDDTSPCIDAGNPGCPEANEPLPNGGRINMGAYGGTAQASKSPVNWRSIADMTNDWILDFNDLKVFVSYWLERGECVPSDLNRNESVDFADFCILGQQWSDTNAVKAHSLYPADGSVILGDIWEGNIYTLLIFTPGATAVKHTGYFSEDYSKVESRAEDANLGSPPYTYIPGWEYTFFAGNPQVPPANHTLVRGTQYYWTVDETDAMGNTFPGDIWEFAVQGYYAFEPDPPNEAVDVDTTVLLSWYPGLHMVNRNDVYIGTSWDDVNNADSTDTTGIYKGYTSETFYQCSNLAFNTTYYWRIDELYCHPYPYCHYYKGDVWCFTTVPPNLGAIKEELWFGIAGRAIGDLYSDPGSTTHTVVNHRQDRKGNGGRINMGAYGGTPEASKSYFSEPVCETIIAGDINGDCKVNFLDFSLMAFHWLKDNNP